MPQHKPVLSLLNWSLKSVECLVKNLVLDTSDKIINQRNLVNLCVVFYVSDLAVMFGILNKQIDKLSQASRDQARCDRAGVRHQTVHTGARGCKYPHGGHIRLAEGEQNIPQMI